MKNQGFVKSLLLHIRYPWTAISVLILWIGLAVIASIVNLSVEELMIVVGVNGVATLIVALIGFK